MPFSQYRSITGSGVFLLLCLGAGFSLAASAEMERPRVRVVWTDGMHVKVREDTA